ncbi:NAD(P)H-dependent glycerol-3-phosphate dehydrogenase [Caenimonas koreensis DSM 17982]|uniref:Glycerol-3-phosphate dehydrogenase [NAD(P)+] n=1 Tax=Caenimonas koreensis DSM 17982 TaxID=1121255 RepID=A0A844AZL2_9BURK|nr:NAD(P)H-dependent glycerol-3-phosphate dehydrogenase [Caenimonas koreensis]MRD46273.1 NAD(P)H-dependent glycerol-3-phosphate dehydrogenase [Caenimonas koreensis DSM 17982]
MKIAIFGAGAWGTALASAAAARHDVTLVARDAQQAQAMQSSRENQRYLAGVALAPQLNVVAQSTALMPELAGSCELAVIATPMAGLRQKLIELQDCPATVAWLCKGFELPQQGHDGLLGHEIRAQVAPRLQAGVLSGPSFALEVARGQPTALVAASSERAVREALVRAFHGANVRVYANDDLVGVEVGGAVKNVLAIATGLCDGLGLGLNARAALITRGLAEMTRLGIALGARAETFMGLSGLGDLVLTATGDLSRNRQVGLALAKGQTLDQAVASLGHVAEGVNSARTVVARALALGVDMPIASGVVALLDGAVTPAQALAALMGRGPAAEA